MTDRAIESLPRQREPGASPQSLLPADVRGEPRQPAPRANAAEPRRKATALAFLAVLDPLPSDYYLG